MASARPMPVRPSEELDELTLRRAQRGEDEACRALVLCYQQRVFAFLSRALSPRRATLVEDVAQETFLGVFRALARFSPAGTAKLSTWILTIASRRAIDAMRRMPPEERGLGDLQLEGGDRADAGLRQRDMADLVRAAIDELAPEYRAAFVLRNFHGLGYQEIATALGIELGTVKSRLARARQRIAESLEEADQ